MVNPTQIALKVLETRISASWLYCTNFVSLNTGKTDVVRPATTPAPDPENDGGFLPIQCVTNRTGYNQVLKYNEWSSEIKVGIWIGTDRQSERRQRRV